MINNFFFFFENHAVNEKMWENIEEPGRQQIIIWSMRIAGSIPKATNTHSEYANLIAFSLQKWLQECTSVLRHK